jgi:hypothetical protein
MEHVFDPSSTIPVVVNNTPAQDAPIMSSASVEIQNGTWKAGLAARLKKQLTDAHYTVTKVGNTVSRPQAVSGIYAVSARAPADTIAGLEQELHMRSFSTLPPDVQAASSTDILIVIGNDTTLE